MQSAISKKRYKCKDCIYYYDPRVGDPKSSIPPGTPFESLPDSWKCPVCGVGKKRFKMAG